MENIMTSKSLFKSPSVTPVLPDGLTTNEAGGLAYSLSAKEALAQLAVTGCFNNTYYTKADDQLARVKDLAAKCEPEFVAKLAVYSRTKGFLKDMPAFLLAHLAGRVAMAHKADQHAEAERLSALVKGIFPAVVDNGKMLKNFVQIVRSGEAGRKSLGSSSRTLVRDWFESRADEQVFFQSIGNDPSLGDIVALAHPRPATKERAALFGYLRDKSKGKFEEQEFVVADSLPAIVASYEDFKKSPTGEIPKVPFEMLEGLPLTKEQWAELAVRQSWQSLRQRLNLFHRKGAFASKEVVKAVAAKLADADQIAKARAMPYQLLVAYLNVSNEMPIEITNALQDATEVATRNVPTINDVVCIFPDVSGSMHSPVTGTQVNPKTGRVESHTSKVTCIDVAALVSASFLRVNPQAIVIPFETKAITDVRLNPKDSIMTNAEKLRQLGGGGTNCSSALEAINHKGIRPALCLYISDNESWMDSYRFGAGANKTETMRQWDRVKNHRSDARLVCNDIQPFNTSQVPSRDDILNIGGWSDACFEVIKRFCDGSTTSWVAEIEATT